MTVYGLSCLVFVCLRTVIVTTRSVHQAIFSFLLGFIKWLSKFSFQKNYTVHLSCMHCWKKFLYIESVVFNKYLFNAYNSNKSWGQRIFSHRKIACMATYHRLIMHRVEMPQEFQYLEIIFTSSLLKFRVIFCLPRDKKKHLFFIRIFVMRMDTSVPTWTLEYFSLKSWLLLWGFRMYHSYAFQWELKWTLIF